VFGVLVHTMDLDDRRSEDERHFLMRFLEALSGNPAELDAILEDVRSGRSISEHVALIESRKGKIYALQQALLLALSDGEYQRVERQGLQQLAAQLELDELIFEELEKWAAEGAAWQIRGAALLAR